MLVKNKKCIPECILVMVICYGATYVKILDKTLLPFLVQKKGVLYLLTTTVRPVVEVKKIDDVRSQSCGRLQILAHNSQGDAIDASEFTVNDETISGMVCLST
jgi:hypothetical protein